MDENKILVWKKDPKARKDIANYMLMAITGAIAGPTSIMLLRNTLISEVGWDKAGYWQAVWKISEVYLGVITIALSTYYLPRLSSLSSNIDAVIREINKTAKIIIPIVTALAFIVYFLRDFVIWILFTNNFSPARELFSIQLIGDVVKITSWLYAYPMLSQGATKWFISSEIIFAIFFSSIGLLVHPYLWSSGCKYCLFN
ncbi:hypothetical protein PROPEN_00694 [Proteus penneri ATCC 35198]|nr:hypothetical protein PROPEN_00694 [Proteus penneri ATCC 35198]